MIDTYEVMPITMITVADIVSRFEVHYQNQYHGSNFC